MEILKNFRFYVILGILLIFATTIMSNLSSTLGIAAQYESWSSLKAYKIANLYGIKLYLWHSIGLMILGYAYYIMPKK
jgi:hypothetical protein